MIIRGIAFGVLAWLFVIIQTRLISFLPAPLTYLQPVVWLVLFVSLNVPTRWALILAVYTGVLMEFWSLLPFGVTLAAVCGAVITARAATKRWLTQSASLALFFLSTGGYALFLIIRDAVGIGAGFLGVDTAWLGSSYALAIQLASFVANAAALVLLVCFMKVARSVAGRTFRLGYVTRSR